MNRTILQSAKSVQIFKSDRLGVRFYEDGSAALFALAYEIAALDENGDVHFSGVCVNGVAANGQKHDEECCVIAEVIRGDVEELLATCLSEEDEKNDVNVLGFYQDLLDYSKKCPGTVFAEDAIEYIRAKIYEYGEKVRLKE